MSAEEVEEIKVKVEKKGRRKKDFPS